MSQLRTALYDTYRVVAIALLAAPVTAAAQSTLISGARVLDGTGRPAVIEDVRIIGDRIADIGQLHQRQGESRSSSQRPRARPGIHRHAQPRRRPDLRAPRCAGRCEPGRDHRDRRAGRRIRLSAGGILRQAASDAGRRQHRELRGPRDPARQSARQRLPPRVVAAGSAEDGRAAGRRDEGGRARPLDGPRVRPGHLLRQHRTVHARQAARPHERPLHQPRAQRGPLLLGRDQRDHRHRTARLPPGTGVAHQARDEGDLGDARFAAQHVEPGAGGRSKHHRRRLSLRVLAEYAHGALPRARFRQPELGGVRARAGVAERWPAAHALWPQSLVRRQDAAADRRAPARGRHDRTDDA